MVSNPHFITNDAQMFSVSKAFTGEITLERVVNVLAQSNKILYPQIQKVLENKIGIKKSQRLFSQAQEILDKISN